MARLLVVDDYDGFLDAMEYCLPKFGYAAVCCPMSRFDCATAIESGPDCILVGFGQSPNDGFNICRLLKADIRTKDLPIVVLANPYSDAVKAEASALGVTAILGKPFEWPSLLENVARIIAERRERAP